MTHTTRRGNDMAATNDLLPAVRGLAERGRAELKRQRQAELNRHQQAEAEASRWREGIRTAVAGVLIETEPGFGPELAPYVTVPTQDARRVAREAEVMVYLDLPGCARIAFTALRGKSGWFLRDGLGRYQVERFGSNYPDEPAGTLATEPAGTLATAVAIAASA